MTILDEQFIKALCNSSYEVLSNAWNIIFLSFLKAVIDPSSEGSKAGVVELALKYRLEHLHDSSCFGCFILRNHVVDPSDDPFGLFSHKMHHFFEGVLQLLGL